MRHGWSLNSNDWDKLDGLPIDGIWKRVSFSQNAIGRVIDKPGVYMITARVPGSTTWESSMSQNPIKSALTPLYIGMDRKSLRRRFTEHIRQPSATMMLLRRCFAGADIEYWYIQLTEDLIPEVERVLISAMGPTANQKQGIVTASPPRMH